MDVHFAHCRRAMRLDRLRADVEQTGDVLVALAFGDETYDLALACREGGGIAKRLVALRLDVSRARAVGRIGQAVLADPLRLGASIPGALMRRVPIGREREVRDLVTVGKRKDHDFGRRRLLADLAGRPRGRGAPEAIRGDWRRRSV